MATLFTKIIAGELPGTFVWKDARVVAFLSIRPLRPGHTLVVPRVEVDHWIDLDAATLAHMMEVAQTIGKAQQRAFSPTKVGMMLAGLEVAHTHLHLVPIHAQHDLDFARQDMNAKPEDLAAAAKKITGALEAMGVAHGA